MARRDRTVEQLKAIAADLSAAAANVAAAIQEMKGAELQVLLVHGKDVENNHIPVLFSWASRVKSDAEVQCKAFRDGKRSQAHINQARSVRQTKKKPAK